MKKLFTLLVALLLVFVSNTSVFATGTDIGADLNTSVEFNDDNTVTVILPSALASDETIVRIPCDLSSPIVKYNGSIISSRFYEGLVEFIGAKAGTYYIVDKNVSYSVVNTCTK